MGLEVGEFVIDREAGGVYGVVVKPVGYRSFAREGVGKVGI